MIEDFKYAPPSGPFLTEAEIEIIMLRCRGLSNKEIAKKRNRSVQTVKNQLHLAYTRFNVKTFIQLLIKIGEIRKVKP